MECELCKSYEEERTVTENKTCFVVICKWPLKDQHLIVIPKRCITRLEDFTKEESKDFLELCEKMQNLVKKVCKENEEPFLFRNYGTGITQPHIHFHVVPAKGPLRELVTALEKDVPYRKERTNEEMENLALVLRRLL